MRAAFVLLAALAPWPLLLADASSPREAPYYTAESIVNAADFQPGPLAPNTLGTLFGTGLAYVTRGLAPEDIVGGVLPNVLPGTGVRILIGGLAANILYVSPGQINFLVPNLLRPGRTELQVVRNGLAGPPVPFEIASASPAIFQADAQTVIAARPDGSPITADQPAKAGDILTLYATGLGDTVPPVVYSNLSFKAAQIRQFAEFKLLLDGMPLDSSLILYAGIAPGFAGLYQINVQIPHSVSQNPEVQIGLGDSFSPAGIRLPLDPLQP